MKKLFALMGCFLSFSTFASTTGSDVAFAQSCPIADIGSPQFCEQFKVAAKCYCDTVIQRACPTDMNVLYALMMAGHPNLEAACRFQYQFTHLDVGICIQHWTYQRSHC